MRPWTFTVAVLAACGGPPNPKTSAPQPIAIAPTTCVDVGVILRGKVDSDDPAAGSAREAAIAQACTGDKWAPDLIACVGASRTPEKCLDHLPAAAKTSYEAQLTAWTAKYPAAPPPEPEDDTPAAAATTACEDVASALDRLSGDLTIEHDWALAARKRAILQACLSDQWAEVAKHCITALEAGAPTLAPLWACIDLDANLSALKTNYLAADARMALRAQQIAKAKQKPTTIACGKVVAAYYADAAWKGKLDDAKPAERKKAIAGSRSAMQKACTTDKDKWEDTLRACLVASNGDEDCFSDTKVASRAWGFPALEIKLAALPPKCVEYRKALEAYVKCNPDGVDANTIATVLDSMAEQAREDPKSIDDACAGGLEAMKQMTQQCH